MPRKIELTIYENGRVHGLEQLTDEENSDLKISVLVDGMRRNGTTAKEEVLLTLLSCPKPNGTYEDFKPKEKVH